MGVAGAWVEGEPVVCLAVRASAGDVEEEGEENWPGGICPGPGPGPGEVEKKWPLLERSYRGKKAQTLGKIP